MSKVFHIQIIMSDIKNYIRQNPEECEKKIVWSESRDYTLNFNKLHPTVRRDKYIYYYVEYVYIPHDIYRMEIIILKSRVICIAEIEWYEDEESLESVLEESRSIPHIDMNLSYDHLTEKEYLTSQYKKVKIPPILLDRNRNITICYDHPTRNKCYIELYLIHSDIKLELDERPYIVQGGEVWGELVDIINDSTDIEYLIANDHNLLDIIDKR